MINNLLNNENIPFAQVFYQGIFLLLINSKGKILYSITKGNLLFGGDIFMIIKGNNILKYLKENENYLKLKTFFKNDFENNTLKNDLLIQIFKQKEYETIYGDQISFAFNQSFNFVTSSYYSNVNNSENHNHNHSFEIQNEEYENENIHENVNQRSGISKLSLLSRAYNNQNNYAEELSFNDAFE